MQNYRKNYTTTPILLVDFVPAQVYLKQLLSKYQYLFVSQIYMYLQALAIWSQIIRNRPYSSE